MGKWFVDGYDLSRLAFNIRNRDAGWKVAGRRGENNVVPGRSGSIHTPNKPSDVGKVALDMWAVGANVDGTIPKQATSAQTVRMHLDRLTSLFRQSRLVEIVRVEDGGSEFGRVNLLPNPSFTVADPDSLADLNGSLNGSAEVEATTSTVVATNQAVNPAFRKASTSTPTYNVRRNMFLDPNATTMARVFQNSAPHVWTVQSSVVKSGTTAFRIGMAPGAAASTPLGSLICPIIRADQEYSARLALRLAASTPGRLMAVAFACYDASNTYLGYATIDGNIATYAIVSGAAWVDVIMDNIVMQPGTTQGLIQIINGDALNANEHVYIDEIQVEEERWASSFFTGDTPAANGITYQWEDGNGIGMTVGFGSLPEYVTPQSATDAYIVQGDFGVTTFARAEYRPGAGSRTKMAIGKRELYGSPSASTIPRNGPLAMSLMVRPSRTMQVQLTARFTRSTGIVPPEQTLLGPVFTLPANIWTTIEWEGFGPPTWEAKSAFTWFLLSYEENQKGDVLDVRSVMLQNKATVDDFFEGGMGGVYDWLTEPEGQSVKRLAVLQNWSAGRSTSASTATPIAVVRSDEHVTEGGYAAKATAETSGLHVVVTPSFQFSSGDTVTFGVDVFAPFTGTVETRIVESSQGATDSEVHTLTHPVVGGQFNRLVHTVTLETLGSIITVQPQVWLTMNSGNSVWLDGGYLGYDADGDYVDGDDEGWSWTTTLPFGGTSNVPFAVRYAESVLFWQARGGLMVVDSTWKASGTRSALVVATANAPVTIMNRDYPTRGVDIGVPADEGETYTFSITARARERARVQLQMRRARLVLDGWEYDPDYLIEGAPIDLNPNQVERVKVTATPVDFGEQWTHAVPQIKITDRGTSEAWVDGHGVWIDSALFDRGVETTYFDGDSTWGAWTGEDDVTTSRIYGPARRAMIEVMNAIDMSSMAGGTRATFTVEAEIPTTFWEDTHVTTSTMSLIQDGQTMSLSDFAGTSASIEDAVIEIRGNVTGTAENPIVLTDVATGAWISIAASSSTNAPIVIDCDQWTVKKGGVTIMDKVRHAGSPRLLPLTADRGQLVPRLHFSGAPVGTCRMVVKARRKFHLA